MHRPINRKSSHFQLRHEGFYDFWLSNSLFFRLWFFFEFVLALGALGAHPAPRITCKNIKTRLVCGIFLFYTSRLLTFTMEQTYPQRVDLPLLPWVKVYRKEPSAFIYDEHSRECTMFHFGIYRHSLRTAVSHKLGRVRSIVISKLTVFSAPAGWKYRKFYRVLRYKLDLPWSLR